ncbi:MAG: ankyrin repeat domain-containing protein [Acidobacteriota bacterium]|nr:ankyrin repeat domain-containing protein [Acidobacteriota bacterium]
MSALPEHPDLSQARRRAKELLAHAQAGDADALARLAAHAAPLTLAGAQLTLAREHGQPSWPALVHEIDARNAAIPEEVMRFLRSSVNLQIGVAARMLHENPALAGSGFPAAVVLGDAARVAAELRRDPAAAARVDPGSGWTPLHLVCASRFHLDPARAAGLANVARLLLDAGAVIDGKSAGRRCWRPLECAVTSANSSPNNEPIIRLLLDRGAPVRSETVVASLYAAGGTWCLEMLTEAAGTTPEILTEALAEAAIGSDPAAVGILLAAGADPDLPGPDGRSARRKALTAGGAANVALLGAVGDDPVDRLLEALATGDRDAALTLAGTEPGLVGGLQDADREALVAAAEHGDAAAVELMLELGFPVETRRLAIDDDGATALHAAAWAGSADTVVLLLAHGADPTARDARWQSQPLGWALVGSGELADSAPSPDWVRTVSLLLDAGASLDGDPLDPDDPKPPSAAVVELLRSRGLLSEGNASWRHLLSAVPTSGQPEACGDLGGLR